MPWCVFIAGPYAAFACKVPSGCCHTCRKAADLQQRRLVCRWGCAAAQGGRTGGSKALGPVRPSLAFFCGAFCANAVGMARPQALPGLWRSRSSEIDVHATVVDASDNNMCHF